MAAARASQNASTQKGVHRATRGREAVEHRGPARNLRAHRRGRARGGGPRPRICRANTTRARSDVPRHVRREPLVRRRSPASSTRYRRATPSFDGLRDAAHRPRRRGSRDPTLIPVDHPFTPAQSFVLDTAGAGLTVSRPGRRFSSSTSCSTGRSTRARCGPSGSSPRWPRSRTHAVDRTGPRDRAAGALWNPDLPTMETVFSALQSLPLVQSATLDDLFATVSTNRSSARTCMGSTAR